MTHTLSRLTTSCALLICLALPTTVKAYDPPDLMDIAAEQGDSLEQVQEENSAGWIFKAIHWLAEKTAPNAPSSASSNDPLVISEVLLFGQDMGSQASASYGNGYSSVRAGVLNIHASGSSTYDITLIIPPPPPPK